MSPQFNQKILVINEAPHALRITSSILSRIGYQVLTADSGQAGLETASRQAPDLIIIGEQLPDMSAVEFCRLLREKNLKNAPAVLITDQAIADGTASLSETPVELLRLIAQVAQRLERRQTEIEQNNFSKIGAREQALAASKKQVTDILESITDGFFALDGNWNFTYVNSAAEKIWQLTREDLIGKNILAIFPDMVDTSFFNLYRRVMTEKTTLSFTELYPPADSWREVRSFPAEDGISVYFRDVTEQKKAGELLKRNEEKFRALIENSADGVTLIKSDGTIIDLSPAGERMLGYSREELIGKIKFDDIYPDDLQKVKQLFTEINSKPGQLLSNEYRVKHSNGSWIWIESTWNNLLENENVEAIVQNYRDITDRKLSEAAMLESREMFRLAMRGSRMGAWTRDLLKDDVEWSAELEAIFGLPKGSFAESRDAFYEKVHWDDRELVKRTALTAVAEHRGYTVEFRFHHSDGSLRWMEGRGEAIYGPDGKPVKVYGIGIDITERKLAEEKLQQSEARFRSVVEQSIVGITQADMTGRYLSVNDYFCKMLGYSRDELLQMTIQEITYPADAAQSKQSFAKFVADGLPIDIEKRYVHRDGSAVWVHNSISLIRDGEGKPHSAVAIIKDITARKQAEENLRDSEARLRLALEISQTATFEINLRSDAMQTDAVGRAIFGFETNEPLTFKKLQTHFHPEDLDEVLSDFAVALDPQSSGEFAIEQRIVRTDREIRWVKVRGRFFFEGSGESRAAVTCIGTYIDITELKLAEKSLLEKDEQLRQAQKLESVGLLAGGIAHDFNNMLTVINGYSNLILKSISEDHPIRSKIEEIKQAGERSAALTQQLLAFSRRQILQPKILDLNEVVHDTGKMLKRLIGEDIDLYLSLSSSISRIKADPGQLSQVIINLAVNSRDAMPTGGLIKIETENVFLDENFVENFPPLEIGSYVLLKITDNGSGMDAETKERIFEPFFTNKPVGEGTGLGLAMVYGIIKQSGGYIWAESEMGQGTTFRIYLPPVEEAVKIRAESTDDLLHSGTETILLVEDEETVRMLTKLMLEECGYEVLTAAGGKEALEICRQSERRIDLLITDVVMPEMGGRELSERLALILPKLMVLFTSGYTDDAVMRHGITETGQNFIQKPYNLESLSKKVRNVIDQAVGSRKSEIGIEDL